MIHVANLKCPDCGAPMKLRDSRFGKFYGCTEFPKCKAAHGAHADGRPLGIPASKPTKEARIRAHAAFDSLWKPATQDASEPFGTPSAFMSRSEAYAWLAEQMGLTSEETHIGRFDIAQCERVIQLVRDHKG